ncbi:MAG TPA: hypothetical protein VIK99_03190 [Thermaerobacter sp.]
MRRLVFKRPHHLNKLHEELLEKVPALRPRPGPSGEPEAVLLIGGDGGTVEMLVPDDLTPEDIEAIQAVVEAHDPTPPPPPPDPDEELIQAISRAKTLEELKEALIGRLCKAAVKARSLSR